jgi:nucleoside-diphosphate-sugar epimerase
MRVLITGGTGHLGIGVCKAFVKDGFNVRLLCHKKQGNNLGSDLEIVWGDITQPDSVKKAVNGVDAVVHMAGLVQPLTEAKPELATRVNVEGTRTMVNLIKERAERVPFVFTSSAAVYGPCPDATELLSPDRTPCNPTSVYAETKLRSENLIKESGIRYVILRLTSVPDSRRRISDFKTQMFTIPLKNRVEFCHADDLALAILNAVKNFDRVEGSTLMIGGGPSQQMLFEDMLRATLNTFGLPLPPRHKFSEEPFPLHWYDTTKSQELLKYQHKTLDDYCRDLAGQFPAPLIALMRHFIGPVFGRIIVRVV